MSRKNERVDEGHLGYVTYVYRGVPYVPHYCKPDCYVPPGYSYPIGPMDDSGCRLFYVDTSMERTASQLVKAGAIPKVEFLWARKAYEAKPYGY